MPLRESSPAESEFELDISNALADTDFLSGDDDNDTSPGLGVRAPKSKAKEILNVDDILEGSGNDDSGGEEAFIAAQQAAHNRKASTVKGKKGGGFQAMGLGANLRKAIARKGFSVPTPIQRKTIPLVLDGLDVVGMARTGSGKTAAFVIPMIEKLKAHSAKVGARAIILSPSRELALQTLKVVKDFGKGADLTSVLLVGGDSLEDQFGFLASNPDVIIATPGRFLHLLVEMELDLKSVQYIVFDEADRLFEMGFASQLTEILHALPSTRQTLLFSATLPKALTDSSEKEGVLIHLLKNDKEGNIKDKEASSHSTIVFAATKHHVEYLANLIRRAGYPVSYVYGALDQVARRQQVARFRSGETQILVVTDVAARGIDIPILANVINYDFPPQPKVFVHRVGRTARAGRRGWAYSMVRAEDAPYLIDLQLFLGRKIVFGKENDTKSRQGFNFAQDVIVGTLQRDLVERAVEAVNKLLSDDSDLNALKNVSVRAEKQYNRSRPSASSESVKRAKEVVANKGWTTLNPLFVDEVDTLEVERAKMLARVSNFRPPETIFEVGQRGLNRSEAANIMRKRREKITIDPTNRRGRVASDNEDSDSEDEGRPADQAEKGNDSDVDMSEASDDELAATFTKPASTKSKKSKSKKTSFEDPEHFMSYNPSTSLAEDRGYSITGGAASFTEAARSAQMDLASDEKKGFAEAHKVRGVRWDKKAKKYVARANDEDGSKGGKMIIGESGQKIAASFKSGRFQAWKNAHRIERMPRTGELESNSNTRLPGGANGAPMGGKLRGKMYHKSTAAPKRPDKFRDDYEVRKKRFAEAKEKGLVQDKRIKSELKSNNEIHKGRQLKQKRREKNNRPSKRRKL
ncbi:P-loop containing nucleoside triphosphate hydrolase protein [Sphaerosporella brunnea]|uniref:RNA helicase n=1 Tax=Sphaerosporella brunnea TaxID=1250544 RepID=A0A5J5F1K5_9PEZI|nr:P-loop containing nucleoside triphosphate hydrolase protein [Sphaerosporella brunnea]